MWGTCPTALAGECSLPPALWVAEVKAGYCVALMLTIPLVFIPIARITEFWAFGITSGGSRKWSKNALRTCELALFGLIAFGGASQFDVFIGFVGGASCALFVAPFDTVKTKLQCGTSASIVQALRQNGFKYLFQGTLPRVIQQACTGCIYFGLYEAAKYLLKPDRDEGDRDVWYKIFLKERGKIEKVISVPVA